MTALFGTELALLQKMGYSKSKDKIGAFHGKTNKRRHTEKSMGAAAVAVAGGGVWIGFVVSTGARAVDGGWHRK
jgi:hypothetical protein